MSKDCLLCGVSFSFQTNRQKYCSKQCLKKHWSLQNKDKHTEQIKRWDLANKERRREIAATFRKNHPGCDAENNTLRQRRMKQAKPLWADHNKIMELYKQAKEQGLTVDHIIPLKHPLVCGLHVHENMQLMTRQENASKKNSFYID